MCYTTPVFKAALEEAGLVYIPMVFSSGPPTPNGMGCGAASAFGIVHPADSEKQHDVEGHQAVWEAQVRECMALGDIVVEITSHTGKDFFTPSETDAMLSFCTAFEKEHGLRINHETHRNRILYSPWIMEDILKRHPTLRLCADYSHFCVVAEAEPGEPELDRVVSALAPYVRHIHARTGFAEGPQVPDIDCDAFVDTYRGHVGWWMDICQTIAAAGVEKFITITPEHGPAPYAWISPVTGSPIRRVWDVNHTTGLDLQAAYAARFGADKSGSLIPDPEAVAADGSKAGKA